jgi:pantetheine-phosphate adenylyltransferase
LVLILPRLLCLLSLKELRQINYTIDKEIEFLSSTNIMVTSFQGLLVDYAKSIDANILVRGIRSVSDFEYEISLASINKVLSPNIETVFLPTSPELAVVSSSMVKEISKYGGDISRFVPTHIAKAVNDKFGFLKTGLENKECPHCHDSENVKLTDDKLSFLYCSFCGTYMGAPDKI